MSDPQRNGSNGIGKIVANMNWPTVALICLTGGGNWLATQGGNQQNQYGIERARQQVDEMYKKIDEFEDRQKENSKNVIQSLSNQSKLLESSNNLMKLHNELILEVHRALASPTPFR